MVSRSAVLATRIQTLVPEITISTTVETFSIFGLTDVFAYRIVAMVTARTTRIFKQIPRCVVFTLTTLVVCYIHTLGDLTLTVSSFEAVLACSACPISITISTSCWALVLAKISVKTSFTFLACGGFGALITVIYALLFTVFAKPTTLTRIAFSCDFVTSL